MNGSLPGYRRHDFYYYCRQNGLWPKEVAGIDPDIDPEAFKQYCPVVNVTHEYAPALLAHGDRDDDVPYQQSVYMASALARAGVEHELVTLHGAGHCFVHARQGDYPNVVKRSVAFLVSHLCAD